MSNCKTLHAQHDTCDVFFFFIWFSQLTEADNAPRRSFSNNSTVMVSVRNIGAECAWLGVTRVLQIVPVKRHGHCIVPTASSVFGLSADSRRICGNYREKGGKKRNDSRISAHLSVVTLSALWTELLSYPVALQPYRALAYRAAAAGQRS